LPNVNVGAVVQAGVAQKPVPVMVMDCAAPLAP
jgi:hypothetical protein